MVAVAEWLRRQIVVTFVASWLLKTVVDRLTLLLTKSHGG